MAIGYRLLGKLFPSTQSPTPITPNPQRENPEFPIPQLLIRIRSQYTHKLLMLCRLFTRLLILIVVFVVYYSSTLPAQAANKIDFYIARYLHVTEPIALEMDEQGNMRLFSPQELSIGKQLFENNCINCHVGGATLPDPQVSLSLLKLQEANPPRDRINALVTFMRQPMTYDGSQETYWCRQLPPSLLSQQQIESLAAFVLTAAQKSPGWGTESF
ncbi:photosystem II cytochrome PsbV2 [Dendronalium sp. ChiSLP03b]|uniref:photosystem II cytochrome PsbV2 n=1 Tax=Dendronalium sp. ChiSLP03b TaxID=3075381 RepID=UPI002AD2FADF|nr:photosystem II cytochrome PsbV2 [Dendronalium sp. ChiSLP03b]MDZ8209021.1 photosystem II cytochrome PsbV2 [Dendronalium sp. ChiSLP03b]